MPYRLFRSCPKILLILFFVLLCPAMLFAQDLDIIPYPKSVVKNAGQFVLDANTLVGMNDTSLLPLVNYLQDEVLKASGIALGTNKDQNKTAIDLKLIQNIRESTPGSYFLTVAPGHITVSSASKKGVFYGVITLVHLLKAQLTGAMISIPACQINDEPRYQWRGFMLDESRHFFGKQKVKQLLDWMAFYKLNKFHWHLTDAQGWRLAIKKYPLLTSVGAIGNHSDTLAEAKYYTQDDIKEVVAYAQARFITVIPEIDMPGHATAANKAYPEFSGGSTIKYPNFTFDPANENTYRFLGDILRETNSLFPSHMIHLGGDEVALGIQAWAGRPEITTMLVKNRFNSLADLEHYFFRRMADTVISMGNKVLCWDEAAESDLPADKTIIFWWRQNLPSSLALALQKKYEVVLCPRLPMYFDFVQDRSNVSGRRWNGSFNTVSEIYNFPDKQLPAMQLQSPQILGVQANLWTELVGSQKRLDYMIFPRIAALSEAGWTADSEKNETAFNERLKTNFAYYDKAGIYYYNPFDPQQHPEAIDFRPNIEPPVLKSRRHGGRRFSGRHHEGAKRDKHHPKGQATKKGKKVKRKR